MTEEEAKRKIQIQKGRMTVKDLRGISSNKARIRFDARAVLSESSLQDLITLSRIVVAPMEDVKLLKDRLVSVRAKRLANQITHVSRNNSDKERSVNRLDKVIVQRNEKENKPTRRTQDLYKKLMGEN